MDDITWLSSKGYKLSDDELISFCERVGMKVDYMNWKGSITKVRVEAIKEIMENRNDR